MGESRAPLLVQRDNEEGDGTDSSQSSPSSPSAVADAHAKHITQLYERYSRSLFRYLTGLLPRRSDAEDVLQETYARLLKAEHLERSDGRARAYVFKVATNLAYDCFRRPREQSLDAVRIEQVSRSLDDTPDAIVGFSQALDIVKRTLLELKPRCRQVFLLRVSEELSYEAIAERLGVSKRTVEREMQHALEVFQTRLKRSRT